MTPPHCRQAGIQSKDIHSLRYNRTSLVYCGRGSHPSNPLDTLSYNLLESEDWTRSCPQGTPVWEGNNVQQLALTNADESTTEKILQDPAEKESSALISKSTSDFLLIMQVGGIDFFTQARRTEIGIVLQINQNVKDMLFQKGKAVEPGQRSADPIPTCTRMRCTKS